jgi:hypothetical protein
MDSTARLTKQGVRDLDFGVKKKPVPVPEQETHEAVDGGGDSVAAVEAVDGKVSRSPPSPAPKSEPPRATAVVVP